MTRDDIIENPCLNSPNDKPESQMDILVQVKLGTGIGEKRTDLWILMSGYYSEEDDEWRVFDLSGKSSTVEEPNEVIGWRYIDCDD